MLRSRQCGERVLQPGTIAEVFRGCGTPAHCSCRRTKSSVCIFSVNPASFVTIY